MLGPRSDLPGHPARGSAAAEVSQGGRRAAPREAQVSSEMAALQRMAGQVAHDLNNYLTVFIGYGELLQSVMSEEDHGRPYLSEMLRSADRAAEYTSQLVAFGGRQVLDIRTVDLNDLIRDLEPALRSILGDDRRLDCALEPGLPGVDLDPDRFGQVLLTLARVARETMPRGTVLRVETEEAGRNGDGKSALLLRVIDPAGVAGDEGADALFEPFAVGENGRSLALAATFGTLVQHGASVDVRRLPDSRQCVTIRIPVCDHA